MPYICIGVGCGTFSYGFGRIINYKTLQKRPDLQKQQEISQNDERNIAISSSAKAKAYDLIIYVFGALLLSYAFMGVDKIATLLLVVAYLLVIICGLYYRIKYEKHI